MGTLFGIMFICLIQVRGVFTTEVVAQRCSVKKVLLKTLQNSQENTCAKAFIKKEIFAQVFACEFCEIFKNTFFHRTRLVDASVTTLSCIYDVMMELFPENS